MGSYRDVESKAPTPQFPSEGMSKGEVMSGSAQPVPRPGIIQLPPPTQDDSVSVMSALQQRRTVRTIAPTPLPRGVLSTLLWAAWGINRPNGPFGALGRTAASASNSQEIDVYVALAEGTFRYEALGHRLQPVSPEELRPCGLTPGQRGVDALAPVQLIYVADLHRLTHTTGFQEPGLHDPEVQKSYYFVDAGLIAGNVALFAASHGLAAWFHNCDRRQLAAKLGVRPEQRVLFVHSIGYPAGT